MKNKIIAGLAAAVLLLCGTSAYANSAETSTSDYSGNSALDKITEPETATATPKPSRTISTEGTGHVVDNITDSEDLHFISVTAKDGSVFFVVIDKKNANDNVYFLNKVDISDLEALAKDNTLTSTTVTPAPSVTPTPDPAENKSAAEEQKQEKQPISGNMLILILAAIAAAGIGVYYAKVIIPKKKLEQADDLEDFEFEDDEETEEDIYSENDTIIESEF